jgi:MFS family permease
MTRLHDLLTGRWFRQRSGWFSGPWRAVPVLGVTEVLAWGALFYPPVLTVPRIAADQGWSASFAMGGFSLGLLVAGLVSRHIGAMIDRRGGHVVMTIGSLTGAVGLLALANVQGVVAYMAVWVVLGVAMAAGLYDPAFASLGRIFGAAARRPITALTFIGGFASTVSWPVTQALLTALGWRGTYLVYAALLAFVAAPLHAFVLPRGRAEPTLPRPGGEVAARPPVLPARGSAFLLVATAFAAYAFVPSALSAHLLAMFGRAGLDAATVVAIGALFGPAQVAARLIEFTFAGSVHPLNVARFAVGLVLTAFAMLFALGLSVPVAAAFSIMFGMTNGLITIARGTVPLYLFGPTGYGLLVGRIGGPWLVMQAAAPLVLAFVAERSSDTAALALVAALAAIALVCLAAIRRPKG